MHSCGGTIWPSPGKKWLIFCLAGKRLWQEFQCNDSLGPGGSGSAKTPSAAEQLGNPRAASALGSSEPGEVPAVALQGQNEKLAAVS